MDTKITILIIEDDELLADEIRQFLEKWGYQAVIAKNFEDILSDFSACHSKLILLDINLPYYDGFYWCSKIRGISNVPILFISSRDDDRDKIMAIAQGGDDYVEKPFQLELLKAKIEAILRRTYQYRVRERLRLGETLFFDLDTCTLTADGTELDLTKLEQKIMTKLLEQRSRVVTREELMMKLWSTDEFVSDGTLTTLISRLRNKLKAFCGDELIRTKKGQGYYIA